MRPLLLGPYSLRAARRAAALALFFQWFIVATGATVRLTGSGLGCPNWPTCTTTRPVPELSMHPMIEFLNRVTATPTLLAALAALWIGWRLHGERRRGLRIATLVTVLGTLTQAVVGAMAVILELPPEVVSAHFLLSLLCMASATVAWHVSGSERPLRPSRAGGMRLLAGVGMLTALLAVIVAGVLTTASGPHSGGAGTGHEVDRLGIFELAVTLHARGAWAFLVLVLLLTWLRRRRALALRDLGLLVALVAGQVALGEVQYRSGLPWWIVLLHVVNAAAIWIVAVRIAADATLEPSEPAPSPDPPSGPDALGAEPAPEAPALGRP